MAVESQHHDEFQRALQLADEQQWDEVRDVLKALAARLPTSAALFVKLGEAHSEMGELSEAEEAFRRATILAPSAELASLSLFHCLWGQEKKSQALDEARRFQSIADSDDYREIITEINAQAEA